MKKVLIVSHSMEIGGAERALLGLLDSFDYSKYQVDLFLMRHTGELFEFINENVSLLPEIPAYACVAADIFSVLKQGQLGVALGRAIGKLKAKSYVKAHRCIDNTVALEYSHKYTKRFLPKIAPEKQYDTAISFLTPHYIVSEKVRAKKKIAWVHTDYSAVEVDVNSQIKMWSAFDKIISISPKVSQTFLTVFPSLKDKITIIENILSAETVKRQAEEFSADCEMPPDSIRLLSVGRFSNAKNFDNIPFICKRLVEKGLNVKWYIIGYGSDEALIRQRIVEASMEERVIILGKKVNPYPHIKACELYVQPSRYEGNCVSVREAQLLCKSVVITRYATSESQLEDGVDGVIVPIETEKCADGIAQVLNEPTLMKKLSDNCKKRDYSNSSEIQKLMRLIEGRI